MKFIQKSLFLCILFLLFFYPLSVDAASPVSKMSLPAITVINPIRGNELGHEKDDLLRGLKGQWEVTQEVGVPATWLWQYSALDNTRLTSFAKSEMKNQEFGLFLEIDRNFAQKAHVQYRGQGPWYFSDGLFVMSYDRAERKQLIDTLFAKFKQTFGYYPKTVGGWWTDADSLVYMQKKYGITASLRAADQFSLDVYSLWGTPWSIPYVSSQENAGIPADNWEDSSKLVTMQWAVRDPTQGYNDSTYSLQDYELKKYDLTYFDYLTSIFLNRPLDQVVIGLENGSSKESFEGHYKTILLEAKKLASSGTITILKAQDYASIFLRKHVLFPPTHYFLTKDFKTNDQSFWYNSSSYRAGIQKRGNNIYLIDLRNYTQKKHENFSVLPNSQGFLRIDEPALIDSGYMSQQKKLLGASSDPLHIAKQRNEVILFSGKQKVASFTTNTMHLFSFSSSKKQNSNSLLYTFKNNSVYINVFLMISGVFVCYFLFLFFYLKNTKKILFHGCLLLIPLLFAHSFLSSGFINDVTFLFDKKEFFLFHLLSFPIGSLPWRIIFVMQVLPLIMLLLLHSVYITHMRSRIKNFLYYAYWIGIIIMYLHVPYFPLDRSTYKTVFGLFIGILLTITIACSLLYLKMRSKKFLIYSLVGIPLLSVVLLVTVIMSRSMLAITPFELSALETINASHKDVLYIYPTGKPIYKAIKPVLYDNPSYGEVLTSTHWKKVLPDKQNHVFLSQYEHTLIFVPRYLGSTIEDSDIQKYSLKKVFDNAQIALFEHI